MITMAPVQQKKIKYELKFKLSVIKYAEENSGEAAAWSFSVDPMRGRDWWKNQTELQYLSEEDSNRARLPGGGRKKASKEPGLNMWEWVISKRARYKSVSRKMIRAKQMYATMNNSRGEPFFRWLNLTFSLDPVHCGTKLSVWAGAALYFSRLRLCWSVIMVGNRSTIFYFILMFI